MHCSFAAVIVPPAAIAGGILGGLLNMNSATNQIKSTELFKINNNNWKIKVPDKAEKGIKKLAKYLMRKRQ